jgi:hypothetical protein
MTRLEKDRQKDKIFLFLDNLKVHHVKLVKEWLSEHHDRIRVFYFP